MVRPLVEEVRGGHPALTPEAEAGLPHLSVRPESPAERGVLHGVVPPGTAGDLRQPALLPGEGEEDLGRVAGGRVGVAARQEEACTGGGTTDTARRGDRQTQWTKQLAPHLGPGPTSTSKCLLQCGGSCQRRSVHLVSVKPYRGSGTAGSQSLEILHQGENHSNLYLPGEADQWTTSY